MKWISNILFLILLYCFFGLLIWSSMSEGSTFDPSESGLVWKSGLVLLLIGLFNIIYMLIDAFRSAGSDITLRRSRRLMLFVKILAIPFFILNFLVWAGFFSFMSLMPLGFIMWIYYPLIAIATFFVLSVTSASSIAAIILHAREKRLRKPEAILHIILQFIYVVDVIDVIYLFSKFKKADISRQLLEPANPITSPNT